MRRSEDMTGWLSGTFPAAIVGGMRIAALGIDETAAMMINAARERPRGGRPLYMTSSNGEVLAYYNDRAGMAPLFDGADMISADGQPLVLMSRILCTHPLPERVATTDLFPAVARAASGSGVSFYLYGATPDENHKAVEAVRRQYPSLHIAGHTHGFHQGSDLELKVAEIDALAPDILWLGLGVPREQLFVAAWAGRLRHVGIIKTSGGLFNFLSGTHSRAPGWMRRCGLEWAFRVWLEPRRLFWRYAITNPVALIHMIRKSR